MKTMAGYFDWLKSQGELYQAKIYIAGDIFHKWNLTPEVINFAIENLPHAFSIAGNHDLPYHSYDQIKKSAYWTITRVNRLKNLNPDEWEYVTNRSFTKNKPDARVYPVPWGQAIKPKPERKKGTLNVALVHDFIWSDESTGYQGAPADKHLKAYRKKLEGYDVAVFGDNHKGFLTKVGKCTVFNCGGFMRTKSDEKDRFPHIGLLMKDGTIARKYVPVEGDKWETDILKALGKEQNQDVEGLVELLQDIKEVQFDFSEALTAFVKGKVKDDKVRQAVLRALEGK